MKLLTALDKTAEKATPPPTPSKPKDFSQAGLNIIQAIEDPTLFGPLFKDQTTWARWKTFLKGLFGLPMTEEEAMFFHEHTGRTSTPTTQAAEAFCIAGRRAGKSFISALVASYLAIFRDWRPYLSKGEIGYIFVVAADKQQSRVILNYVKAVFRLPRFTHLVEKELQQEIRLKNNIVIEIRTASFRSIRGYTILAAILDELAFWRNEESANPAGEILTAILPALATIPDSLLLAISTPYAKSGPLYEAFREFYGKEDRDAPLIWKASTAVMNPCFHESAIRRFFERDKVAARSEYDAEFREDLESYMTPELIEAITVKGRVMLPPEDGKRYRGFADLSGGRKDSFAICICHKDGDVIVLDRLEEVRAPVPQPADVIETFCNILQSYRITEIVGDRFGGNWSGAEFRKHGVRYVDSKLDKNELYLQFQAIAAMRRVQIVDSERLRLQLQQLERRTRPGGHDTVDHPEGLHDDAANVCAGVVVDCFQQRVWGDEMLPTPLPNERAERLIAELRGEDYDRKRAEQEAAEEIDSWMRETGGSKIVK